MSSTLLLRSSEPPCPRAAGAITKALGVAIVITEDAAAESNRVLGRTPVSILKTRVRRLRRFHSHARPSTTLPTWHAARTGSDSPRD